MVGSNWTSWSAVPPQIDYGLSGVPSGAHQITLEVKNKYGTTQQQITIQFTHLAPPGAIPGYSTLIIAIIMLVGISFRIRRFKRR
ncbi:MAG: hypothetical protein ACFFD7_08920 [Candidatus Thorarchaeota archaeon]